MSAARNRFAKTPASRNRCDSHTSCAGFRTLCAFTSARGFFVQMGFSLVPHSWLPEKIQADCRACARFRSCGQYALMLPLEPSCQR